MYPNYFETKIRYEKIDENGKNVKAKESYLFDAMSFTEAESRTIEELSPYISGEFTITDIKRAGLSEVQLYDNGDRFFKCRIAIITLDEVTAKERKSKQTILIQANDFDQAKERLVESLKDTMADYTIDMVKETEIIDVYPIKEKN